MRKNHELRIDRKKLLMLSIATVFLTSTITIISGQNAFAAPPSSVSVGSGPGSIFLTLHRIPQPYWPPCFAPTCYQPDANGNPVLVNGTGTWMYFVVYDSAGNEVGNGLANEDGTLITGLNMGETYRVQPTNFTTDGGPELAPHDVFFNNWADCNNPLWNVNERPFTISSAATVSAAAYYRYHPAGQPDSPLQCFAGVQAGLTPHASIPVHKHHRVSVDMDKVYTTLNMKQAIINSVLNQPAGDITTVSTDQSNVTSLNAKNIPSISLSGIPIGPTGAVVYYKSLYDIQSSDPDGLVNAMNTAQLLGVDWSSLSDMQKAYLAVTLKYNAPTASMIPDTDLSGIPLGEGGQRIVYHSLYDVQNADSDGVRQAMIACDQLGVDWSSLSDMQKAYLILTLDYGLPSSQV